MTHKLIIAFLLFTFNIFSQKTSKVITFDVKSKLYLTEMALSNNKKIPIASADILIKNTKFSILLLDYNQNNYFLDTLNSNTKRGLDGILIADYKRYQNIKKLINERRYFKNQFPFSVNGIQYKLSNFKKINDKTYQAILQNLNIDKSLQIIENKNGAYVNKLPNLKLKNFTNTKTINLQTIPLDKELIYCNFFNDDGAFGEFIDGLKQKKILQIAYSKLKIINICILSERNYIKAMARKFHIKTTNLYYINADQYTDLLKIGYNDTFSNNILFDNSGKVIQSFLNYENLKKYINKRYYNPNRPAVKIKKLDTTKLKKKTFTYKHN